ncbi:ubiquinone/menaquinone biosynthesis C-methylase UbiE [Evansella vedderi]|uniref:Ubiquinone/menaquinone biosynthesis C-methylase UbiE n=1 Tax=Evansella vedderi TaxID=38282 RepID=A0ABT9ZZ89_9BACI|nr:class I SAM-dependent methyltransferase [Evansella vedderi]MDQ0256552.1 ubiquinone/menaquinone biosynthesis C-methylase UbiE [Evansella vedderi]
MNKNNAYMDMLAAYGVTAARPGGRKMSDYVFSKYPIKDNSTILEIGCGIGDTARKMTEDFQSDVTAIDPHPKMIEKAKNRHKDKSSITWINGDLNSYPLLENNFDAAISESVLSFTNISDSLKTIYKLLKEDGFLYLLEPIYLEGMETKQFNEYKDFYGFSSVLTEKEWKHILSETGFSVKNIINSFEVNGEENEEFPELVIDEGLDHSHVETLKKHEYFLENYLAYFDYTYFICMKK